ncbi:hypothetical protein QVD17_05175 [Tagetes erecta]|uniref:Uncharacterized protein n=1 Tax=Tagetes erecta TaxID=13708 RepID=A0AAD8LEJ4_TARER|nr:hypothetical protein QVD17_05175 [Tagetes erecta]
MKTKREVFDGQSIHVYWTATNNKNDSNAIKIRSIGVPFFLLKNNLVKPIKEKDVFAILSDLVDTDRVIVCSSSSAYKYIA